MSKYSFLIASVISYFKMFTCYAPSETLRDWLLACHISDFVLTSSLFCRPKAKSPPQDTLLKLEKERTSDERSQGSSMFVFKLGLDKLKCSLLMNGLVHDPTEVLLI